jgi:hypothetical protein
MVAQCLAWYQKLFGTKPIQPMPTTDIAARCLLIEDGNQLILMTPEWETNSLKNFMGTIRFGEPT